MLGRRAKQYDQARAIPAESPVSQCSKHRPHWMLRSIKSFAKFRLVLLLLELDLMLIHVQEELLAELLAASSAEWLAAVFNDMLR